MLILIAPEKDVTNEINILNRLFEAGLEYYHLRKPEKNYQQHCDYLNQIDSKNHNKIIVHYFHELINEFNLKGIHFTEQQRKKRIDNPGQYFKDLNMFGKTISASFHELKDLSECYFEFDYHFLSPVFDSISKQGYKGRFFDVNHINKYIIGLGGINSENITDAKKLGFKGCAILGNIWNSKDPIETYLKITRIENNSVN